MSECWRCHEVISEADEERITPFRDVREHFRTGTMIRDERGRFLDMTCKGGK